MSNTIRKQILAYSNLELFFKNKTSAANPVSSRTATIFLGDQVTGVQQTHDFVMSFYKKDKLSRIREGKAFKYWWKNNRLPNKPTEIISPVPVPLTYPMLVQHNKDFIQEPKLTNNNLKSTNDLPNKDTKNIPEIVINSRDKYVTIKTSTVKITIEY